MRDIRLDKEGVSTSERAIVLVVMASEQRNTLTERRISCNDLSNPESSNLSHIYSAFVRRT
jgi:hypothetical protein